MSRGSRIAKKPRVNCSDWFGGLLLIDVNQPENEFVTDSNRFMQPIYVSTSGSITSSRIKPHGIDLISDTERRGHKAVTQTGSCQPLTVAPDFNRFHCELPEGMPLAA
jgi:hypothetical protein